jgi:cytochrome c oxidase cbb3-type subunit 3
LAAAGIALLAGLAPGLASAQAPEPVRAGRPGGPPAILLEPDSLAEGKRTFAIYCAICHGQDGWGGFCPNLTDDDTLHGGRFVDMLTVVRDGVFTTPMPRWIGRLGPERVAKVAAYVYTLKGTRPRPPAPALRDGNSADGALPEP